MDRPPKLILIYIRILLDPDLVANCSKIVPVNEKIPKRNACLSLYRETTKVTIGYDKKPTFPFVFLREEFIKAKCQMRICIFGVSQKL